MSAYDQIQATLPTVEDNSVAGCILRHHRGCMWHCVCGCHDLEQVGRVLVIGEIWQPGVGPCAYSYSYSQRDLWEYGTSRCGILEWLGTHAGDFQRITDFTAHFANTPYVDWADPESEYTYNDCMFPSED
jgi:hypothetical protein